MPLALDFSNTNKEGARKVKKATVLAAVLIALAATMMILGCASAAKPIPGLDLTKAGPKMECSPEAIQAASEKAAGLRQNRADKIKTVEQNTAKAEADAKAEAEKETTDAKSAYEAIEATQKVIIEKSNALTEAAGKNYARLNKIMEELKAKGPASKSEVDALIHENDLLDIQGQFDDNGVALTAIQKNLATALKTIDEAAKARDQTIAKSKGDFTEKIKSIAATKASALADIDNEVKAGEKELAELQRCRHQKALEAMQKP